MTPIKFYPLDTVHQYKDIELYGTIRWNGHAYPLMYNLTMGQFSISPLLTNLPYFEDIDENVPRHYQTYSLLGKSSLHFEDGRSVHIIQTDAMNISCFTGKKLARPLATIRQITNITPIDGKDRIELAHIGGWQVIVQKNLYQIGHTVIFVEPDAAFNDENKAYLRNKKVFGEDTYYYVKPMKMAGVISAGIILPAEIDGIPVSLPLNFDVTRLLNIYHIDDLVQFHEDNTSLSSNNHKFRCNPKSTFPSFIPKTDQVRYQNIQPIEKLNGYSYQVTLKMDGSSATYYYYNGKIGVCSRNLELNIKDSNIWNTINDEYEITTKLQQYCLNNSRNLAIQGEIYGEGIQKNPHQIRGIRFACFSIYDIDKQCYLLPKECVDICEELSIPHVPVLYPQYPLHDCTYDSLQTFANQCTALEGVVFKEINNKISFKVVNNHYLIRN